MTYKDILLHLDESEVCAERTRAAANLAQNHEAHLIGLCPSVQPVLPAHVQLYMMKEMILGGVTRHALSHMAVPTLLSH